MNMGINKRLVNTNKSKSLINTCVSLFSVYIHLTDLHKYVCRLNSVRLLLQDFKK